MIRENPRTDRDDASSPEFNTQVESLRADLRALGRNIGRAFKIEWLNLKTEAVDAGVKVAPWCGLLAFFLAAFISAAPTDGSNSPPSGPSHRARSGIISHEGRPP